MYKVDIVTKYNEIHLEVEDINSPEMQEILSQPYIISIDVHKEPTLVRKKENLQKNK